MDRHYLFQFLVHILKSILRYGLFGAGIALGLLLIILLVATLGEGGALGSQRILGAARNYLVAGGAFGGIIGLLYGLLTFRQ